MSILIVIGKKRIAAILKDAGSIDVLVNNAGIEKHGSIEEIPMADFKAATENDYFGALRCIQAGLPQRAVGWQGCMHQCFLCIR
ncbi:MAG: SDR family NAD(P)-dependent oxidoreductase [Flavobacteriaceae bacterium]|nr:SDR family NAD(P)-dependent oxidoreductase [Flavobacteriaceae bacterium]